MDIARLVYKSQSGDKVVELEEGFTLFAGRTVECDIYLPSPAVSRKHAVFVMRGGQCGVKDLDSSNGTYLNGERLARPVRLREGDIIQIGTYSLNFAVARAPSFGEAERTVVMQAVAAARPAVPVPDAPPPAPEPAAPEIPAKAEAAPPVLPAARDASPRRVKEAAERSVVDPGDAGIARDSLRLKQQTPSAPKSQTVILEEEIGDGAADDALVHREEAHEEAAAHEELALSQAAAEAGLVGEFAPEDATSPGGAPAEGAADDDETADDAEAADDMSPLLDEAEEDAGETDADAGETGGIGPDGGGADAAGEEPGSGPSFVDAGPVEPPPREVDPNAIPVDAAFREAIEARLYLYSFLGDMQKERRELLAGLSVVPDAVSAELDRQDREMQKIPAPEKAEQMIEGRMNRRNALKEKIAEAKKNGTAMPPRPSKAMRQAEDIAINQWTIIAQSGKEALPAAIREGFRVVSSEPLADILSGAGIDPVTMMGGGAYYLALEQVGEEAKYNRAFLKARLALLPDPEDKKAAKGGGGLGGLFGRKKEEPEEEDGGAADAAPGETHEELRDAEEHMAARAAWIAQELASLEPVLIKEYWSVYTRAAVHFLQRPDEITLALRAFLRHGVIGFMPWWMSDEVREHVIADCSKEVVGSMAVSRDITNILYADEYLAAVLRNECTPAMDENLEINAKNSPEWKADKALRKLINTRSQMTLLKELTDSLKSRIDGVDREGAVLDDKIKALLPGQKNFKQIKSELGMQRQALKVESTKLSKLAEKIRDETMAQLREVETDTEARFASGELPRPAPEFLIEREVDAVRKIGRLLANLKERFMPLVMRDSFKPGTDGVNDRSAIQGEIADVERRDPRIFLETMVESKKKANRVDVRISPVIVLVPSAGILAFSWNPRQKPEDGRLAIPTCFIRQRLRERQMTYLMSDFRWDTSKANAGMDVMASETIVAAFMGVRWDWRKRSKEGREKGLVYTDQNDRTNWRRVYEAYMSTAFDSGKKLFNRNYDFYERIIGKYFDPPEGVELLRK